MPGVVVPDPARSLREAAVRRLVELDAKGEMTTEHVRSVAEALSVSERTVFRWVARGRSTGSYGRTPITTKGIAWRGRPYVADWMTGQVGRTVRLRYMPHHDHEIEVVDARTAVHLGRATLANQASPEQVAAMLAARAGRQARLKADLKAAEKQRRTRYAPSTTAAPAQPLGAVTVAEAVREISQAADARLTGQARGLSALRGPVPEGWVLPKGKDRSGT